MYSSMSVFVHANALGTEDADAEDEVVDRSLGLNLEMNHRRLAGVEELARLAAIVEDTDVVDLGTARAPAALAHLRHVPAGLAGVHRPLGRNRRPFGGLLRLGVAGSEEHRFLFLDIGPVFADDPRGVALPRLPTVIQPDGLVAEPLDEPE